MDTVSAQTLASSDPSSLHAKALIALYTENKQIVMTERALMEFYNQLGTIAGRQEREMANIFLLVVEQVADDPSDRVARLRETQRVGANDKIIFGTADKLGIATITGDMRFVEGARAQGVDLDVLPHEPYSFTGV